MSRVARRFLLHPATLILLYLTGLWIWNLPPAVAVPRATGTPGPTAASYLPYIVRALPTATPTATATATAPIPAWLRSVNRYREGANLHPLSENASWTQGEWLHSRYMVKEDHISHQENPSSPWYTPEGNAAGRSGNIYVSGYSSSIDDWAISFWMTAPFHAVSILDPQLYETAFASYREAIGFWNMGATLDWQRGLGTLPSTVTFPIYFPGDDGETWLRAYRGGEWPDPLSSCAGYVAPSGPPLILQLGSGNVTPTVTDHGFFRGGEALPHCVFDETSYVNPSPSTQNSGRAILNSRDAVILMPRDVLELGAAYTATVTANGVTYTWSFTVVTPPQPAISAPPITPGMERAGAP